MSQERVSRSVVGGEVIAVLRKRSSVSGIKTKTINDSTLLTGDLGLASARRAALSADMDRISTTHGGRRIRPADTEPLVRVGTLITLTHERSNG